MIFKLLFFVKGEKEWEKMRENIRLGKVKTIFFYFSNNVNII